MLYLEKQEVVYFSAYYMPALVEVNLHTATDYTLVIQYSCLISFLYHLYKVLKLHFYVNLGPTQTG